MADNTQLNKGYHGDLIATDEISGVKYQRVKLVYGPDGTSYGDVDHDVPLPVLPSSHMYSKGTVYGHEAFIKSGFYSVVPVTETYIGGTAGSAPYMPTSPVTIEAISDSADDDAGGTGAQKVMIYGLDANFDRQSEEIIMNGTSASTATTNTYIRIFSAKVTDVGTYSGSNAGNITIRASSGGTAFIILSTGLGRCACSHYCVPAGMKLYIRNIHITTETAKSSTVILWERQNADDVTTPFQGKVMKRKYGGLAGALDFEYSPELYFPEKTDIWATGYAAANTAAITVEYNGILETL